MTIHKEGRTLLVVLLIIFIGIGIAGYFYVPWPWDILIYAALGIMYLLVLQFFRHPNVKTIMGEEFITAPADGKVVVIEKTQEDEYLNEERIQISIFMSPLNVHVNRSPVKGKVSFYKYHEGKYLVAWHPKSSTENERTTLVLRLSNGLEILMRQIAGAVARRIICYAKEGDEIGQGDEFGFIKFGSRVDVFIPLNAEIKVKPGDKTKAGVTVLAELSN